MTEIKDSDDTDTGFHSDFLDEDFELYSIKKPKEFDEVVVRIIGVERQEHKVYGAFLIIKVEIEDDFFTNQLYNEDKPNKEFRRFCTDFEFSDTDEVTEKNVCNEQILIKPKTAYNQKSKEYRKFFDEEGNESYFVNFEYIKRVTKKKKKRGRPKGSKTKDKTKPCPICKEDIPIDEYSDHIEDCEGD